MGRQQLRNFPTLDGSCLATVFYQFDPAIRKRYSTIGVRASPFAQTCRVRRNALRVRCEYVVIHCLGLTEQNEGCFTAAM
jgi:hypothetical protein